MRAKASVAELQVLVFPEHGHDGVRLRVCAQLAERQHERKRRVVLVGGAGDHLDLLGRRADRDVAEVVVREEGRLLGDLLARQEEPEPAEVHRREVVRRQARRRQDVLVERLARAFGVER